MSITLYIMCQFGATILHENPARTIFTIVYMYVRNITAATAAAAADVKSLFTRISTQMITRGSFL
jgi:hypothetical protein